MRTPLEAMGYYALRSAVCLPKPVASRLFGPPPTNDRGAPLDFQAHVLLALLESSGQPNLDDLTPFEAREVYEMSNRLFDLPRRPLFDVEDRRLPGGQGSVPVRVYRPGDGAGKPALVYLHGGGFVIGGLDGFDGLCRALAERTGCVVFSVAYRLAPEHPFPAAVDDCVAVYRWVRAYADDLGIDPERVSIGGDSAGGNLATVVCQRLIERGEAPPARQLLIYPATDNRGGYESLEHFHEGYFLTTSMVTWFTQTYLNGYDASGDPRVAPILFDKLDEMPPAVVITAGFDPLRDEGEAYAKKLSDAGVRVVHRSFDRLMHGFITMGGMLDAAGHAVADIAEEFRLEIGD